MSSHNHKAAQANSAVLPATTMENEDIKEQKELPAMIVLNPRQKIQAEYVNHVDLIKHDKVYEKPLRRIAAHRWLPAQVPREPVPKFPLSISWWPRVLCFKLKDEVLFHKLHISNRSSHMIYFMYCGLWEEAARLGASWHCRPRTRFLLAPGMIGNLYVCAKPREFTPISSARVGLQIAASFPRDTVVGYFVVPIDAQFLNYIEPVAGEGE